MLGNTCAATNPVANFQLFTTFTSCFDDDGATCPPPRRFLAASALYVTVAGAQVCVAANALTDANAGFTAAAGFDHWLFFQYLIGCTCS
jgi:hypothetical protein